MRGFSLVETLVAMLIALGVCGLLLGLLNPAQAMFAAGTQLPDMRQRLRIASDTLARDVLTAGGGPFPAVVPYRRGLSAPDAPGAYRSDCLSVLYIPELAPRTTLAMATDGSGISFVRARQGCGPTDPLCGFRAGMLAVVFDGTGAYDTFLISGLADDPPALLHSGFPLSKAYPPGATVAQAESVTYWLQTDTRTSTAQLMKYDGQQTDLPLADNVSGLRFEYYLDSSVRLDAAALADGPWLPDPSFAQRFDADLLRIRRVRADVRVRAGQTLLHSPVGDRAVRVEMALRSQSVLP
jgi:hypothetical protein